jgi:hypothetical protein
MTNTINSLNAMPNPKAMPQSRAFRDLHDRKDDAAARRRAFRDLHDRKDDAAARRVTSRRKIFRSVALICDFGGDDHRIALPGGVMPHGSWLFGP